MRKFTAVLFILSGFIFPCTAEVRLGADFGCGINLNKENDYFAPALELALYAASTVFYNFGLKTGAQISGNKSHNSKQIPYHVYALESELFYQFQLMDNIYLFPGILFGTEKISAKTNTGRLKTELIYYGPTIELIKKNSSGLFLSVSTSFKYNKFYSPVSIKLGGGIIF